MAFRFEQMRLSGLVLVHTTVTTDNRGFFVETYKRSAFVENGIAEVFVQDNHSCSVRGVLRGLHFQVPPHAQGKLVRVVDGAVWDVAVDIRPQSATYLQWYGLELSQENGLMLYIPPGFAHGFLTLSEKAHFAYKCTAEYDPSCEKGCRWDDPALGIKWPLTEVRVSTKDAALPMVGGLA